MGDDLFVTHAELDEAIEAVNARIEETQASLRTEFRTAFQFEIGRFDAHLFAQDEKLAWINRWTLGVLVTVIGALLYVAFH